jgi:hypothetical protein
MTKDTRKRKEGYGRLFVLGGLALVKPAGVSGERNAALYARPSGSRGGAPSKTGGGIWQMDRTAARPIPGGEAGRHDGDE